MEIVSPRVPRRPREALTTVGTLGAVGVGVTLLYRVTGVGLPCLFHALTGWDCPFCGSTRLGAALLRGDVGAAWRSNQVVFVAAVLLGIRTIGWLVEWRRHPDRGSRWLPAWVSRYALLIGGVVAVAWTLVRNLAW